jgi:hypothetical protein
MVAVLLLSDPRPVLAQAPVFNDVPADYWARSFIETLAFNGVTGGCGNDNYCPESPVTRAQMAVFLERAKNGGGFSPPPATGLVFNDVAAGDFAAAFIEQLAADGITSGCGNGNYCPNAPVTRAQMAIFLLRAKFGAGFSPAPAAGVFNDVGPGDFAAAFIERLAAEGITTGCGNNNFCPDGEITRAQMAVFLVRAFDLQPPVLDPIEQRVADLSSQYGPVLYFHPNEAFMPSSVEWFIGQSELAGSNTDLKCEGDALCDRFNIGSPGDSRQTLLDNLVDAVATNSATYDNLWLETPDITKPGDLAGARSYVHYLDLGSVVDLQYWFFYPFNGPGRARVQFGEIHDEVSSLAPLGEHYGDWEAVILRFDSTNDELLGAFMSAHGVYTWYPIQALEFENGHVLAFSSENGHAIYNAADQHRFDDRVVHEYAGWRNQCIGGELFGNCIGFRTDVGVGTLDVDLLNTTGRGQSFNAFQNYQLVAVDGIPVAGEEWVDLDIRWGQQRSGGAADISQAQFQQIMEDQLGFITLVTVAGAVAACNPLVLAIPVVGPAFCAAYSISIVPALITVYESGTDLFLSDLINESFNGPKTPGAKEDEYLYASCPKESKAGVLCPGDSARQETYIVSNPLYGGGNSNQTGDIDGDGRDDVVSFLNGGTIVVKRFVEEIDAAGVVTTSIQQQTYPTANEWGDGYNWLGDFDGDGDDDIISAIGNRLLVRRWDDIANGEFELRAYIVDGAVYGGAGFSWAADLDGDEKDEVITASSGNIWVKWYHLKYEVDENNELVLEDGEPKLLADDLVQKHYLTANYWSSNGFSFPGDIDGDGKEEILSAIGGSIVVRRFNDNEGDGEFTLSVYPVRPDWWNGGYIWAADIDGDGAEEVLTASGNFVFVRTFNGFGFDEKSIQLPGSLWGSSNVSWNGDTDGDGKDELVTASGASVWVKSFQSIAPTAP